MKARNLLVGLLLFLSAGALFGGGAFLLFPEGWMGMTPELILQHSPFKNFLIPGLILFVVLGLMPVFVVWGLLKRKDCKLAQMVNIYPDMHWSWSWSVYTGFALIIWVYMEVYFLQGFHWLHSFYFFYGVLLLVVALSKSLRQQYSVNNKFYT